MHCLPNSNTDNPIERVSSQFVVGHYTKDVLEKHAKVIGIPKKQQQMISGFPQCQISYNLHKCFNMRYSVVNKCVFILLTHCWSVV